MPIRSLLGGHARASVGMAPDTRTFVAAALAEESVWSMSHPAAKVLALDALKAALRPRREAGQKVAMTNGCFDLLHPGHIYSLEQARAQGDLLVVGLNSDRSVRELKGSGHPIVDQQGRAEMLAALSCVDYVVVFDDASVAGLIAEVLPDVLVKSDEYTPEQVVGRDIVEQHGGRVVLVPMKRPYSTTRTIQQIQHMSDE